MDLGAPAEPHELVTRRRDRLARCGLLHRMHSALVGPAEVAEHFAGVAVQLHHPARGTGRFVELLHARPEDIASELQRIVTAETRNFPEELPGEVEFLDASVLAVGDVNDAVLVDLDGMRQLEFTRAGAGLAPFAHALAVR